MFNSTYTLLITGLAVLTAAPAVAQNYLPLAAGNTWQLSVANVQSTLSITAYSVINGTARATVLFSNPWFSYSMLLRSTSAGVLLEGVQYPSGVNGYPDPVMLFGNGTAGQTWSSAYVTSKLVSTGNTIVTPSGTYTNVARFDIALAGSPQTWYLAPGVGFVQFGTGTGLQLSSVVLNPAPAPRSTQPASCPAVGITANPRAIDDFSATGKETAFRNAVNAGSNFMTIAASWAQLEPSPGVYNFSSVTPELGLASKYGVNAVFTLKTTDTTWRALPSDLAALAWDDPKVLARWRSFVTALLTNLNSRVKYLNLGNEVDTYLSGHPAESTPFVTFVQAGQAVVSAKAPSILTGVVFAFDSWRLSDSAFRTLYPVLQQVSFTYYDANSQVAGSVQRAPADVPYDFADMLTAANGKPLVLTEVGYTSSTAVASSVSQQQNFYAIAMAEFAAAGGSLGGATFSFMSDFPAATISSLTTQYGAASPWVSWVSGLGLFDQQGNSKPAWNTFSTKALAMKANSGCSAPRTSF